MLSQSTEGTGVGAAGRFARALGTAFLTFTGAAVAAGAGVVSSSTIGPMSLKDTSGTSTIGASAGAVGGTVALPKMAILGRPQSAFVMGLTFTDRCRAVSRKCPSRSVTPGTCNKRSWKFLKFVAPRRVRAAQSSYNSTRSWVVP